VARVLVTGMYGTGKSTVLEELRRRGFHTVDTDYGDWEQAPACGTPLGWLTARSKREPSTKAAAVPTRLLPRRPLNQVQ
jgi:hypothetical protein